MCMLELVITFFYLQLKILLVNYKYKVRQYFCSAIVNINCCFGNERNCAFLFPFLIMDV